MNKKLVPYSRWFGQWAGRGETKRGVPVTAQVLFRRRLAEQLIEIVVEMLHAETQELVNGVIAMISVDPNENLCVTVNSTVHGPMIMPATPEDPGVLAIEGRSVQGNLVVVSFLEEDGGLLLTSYWKPEVPAGAKHVGHTSLHLKRVTPAEE